MSVYTTYSKYVSNRLGTYLCVCIYVDARSKLDLEKKKVLIHGKFWIIKTVHPVPVYIAVP